MWKIFNPLTWTTGYGKMIRFTPKIEACKNFKWIKSIDEFNEKYYNPNTWKYINWSYTQVMKKLEKLAMIVDQDPINFLYKLYYIDKKSAYTIFELYWEILWYKKEESLHKLFTITFWWKLRDRTEMTKNWLYKIMTANTRKIPKIKQEKGQKIEKLVDLLRKKSIQQENIEITWKNQLEKLKSFLEIAWIKKKNTSLKDFVEQYEDKKYGYSILIESLNILLKEYWIELKINKWRISELLKWKIKL